MKRREFLAASASLCAATSVQADNASNPFLLHTPSLVHPVVIESVELLHGNGEYVVRVRSKEGVAVANSSRLRETYPIFLRRVAPFFVDKDVRRLEGLIDELYRNGSNYKLQGLAFWVCVAAIEMAILDLLGKASNQSIGEMFGGIRRREIAVYRASGNRPSETSNY